MTAIPNSKYIPLIDMPNEERRRGLGTLTVTRAAARVALPLAKVDISARVAERVASVTVTETFRNPHEEHLEAVYIFPLPGGAAVCDFEMKVGSRVIRGKIEERAEARRQYQQALDEGKRAALLEQERDDVFTVQVGNLPPGEEATVKIVYSEKLPFFEDGTTELRLPLVVAPRYIPGSPLDRGGVGDGIEEDTDIVPDASRITPPRLANGFDPKVGLGIEVEIAGDAKSGSGIDDLSCSQHAVRTKANGSSGSKITLAREDEPLDRDFVLRWRLAGDKVKPSLLVYRDPKGALYGMLSITPPQRDLFYGVARDVVFVVDRSGSMGGPKMASAARACSILLGTLGPRDRFAVQAFDDQVEWFHPNGENGDLFIAADEAGIERGEKYLRGIDARGGTELDQALGAANAAIGKRKETAGRTPVVVLLTDGQIGDEGRVLKRIQKELGDSRVFTVGIDTAVNEGFLNRLASLGGGTSTFVVPGAPLEEALRAVGREIGTPLVVDTAIKDVDAGLDQSSIAPSRIPDLFAGRAVTAFFQLKKAGSVKALGRYADGGEFEEIVEAREIDLPAIAHLWARTRVMDLEDRFRLDYSAQADIKKQIIEIAVSHTLLTRFTAFVVVDESETVNKDGERRKIVQPVETPARWEMGTDQMQMRTTLGAMPTMPTQSGSSCQSKSALINPDLLKMLGVSPASPPASAAPKSRMANTGSFGKLEEPKEAEAEGMMYDLAAPMAEELLEEEQDESFLSKASKAITGIFRERGTKEQSKKAEPKPKPREDAKALEKAYSDFAKAFSDARAAVQVGNVPSADELERTRDRLMKALSESNMGTQLPAIQKFLRGAAVEIIAALKTPKITAAALLPIFERHKQAYETVRFEAEMLTGGSFWESTI